MRQITSYKNLIGTVLIIVIIVAASILVSREKEDEITPVGTIETEEDHPTLSESEKQELFEKIGKHIVLPDQSEPLIVQINNAEDLKKEQAFFENSQDNDILIIYPDKALIYRSSEDILINVGPVYTNNAQPPETPKIQAVSLDIRNGSEIAGRAEVFSNDLGSKGEYNVINIGDASRADYQASILVNLTGKNISALEQKLDLEAINVMPEGESESRADAIIILGGSNE